MRQLLIAMCLAVAATSSVSAQALSDGEIVARSEAEGEAREMLGRSAERLTELTSCVLTLYTANADRADALRFRRFGVAVSTLEEDLSRRVDAHVARFANAKMWNMHKGVLQLSVWRHVAHRMEKAEDARLKRGNPTSSEVASCWLVSDKAIAMVSVLGLRNEPAPTKRR